jgi:hypothetical protein
VVCVLTDHKTINISVCEDTDRGEVMFYADYKSALLVVRDMLSLTSRTAFRHLNRQINKGAQTKKVGSYLKPPTFLIKIKILFLILLGILHGVASCRSTSDRLLLLKQLKLGGLITPWKTIVRYINICSFQVRI